MSSLTTWLLEQIAADEAEARGHEGTAYQHWHYVPYSDRIGGVVAPREDGVARIAADWHSTGYVPVAAHIARHDPARVLAMCAAHRRIVERALGPVAHAGQDIERAFTLRTLASIYAGQDGFREEWA